MSLILGHNPPEFPELARTLRDRCAALGLPAWIMGVNAEILERPEPAQPGAAWCTAPDFEQRLRTTVAETEIGHRSHCERAEMFAGAELVIVPIRTQRKTVCLVAALLLSETASVAGTEPESAAAKKPRPESLHREGSLSPDRLEQIDCTLQWMIDDLTANARLECDVESFGRQLSDTYEEITLLYKLREGISAETNPANFVDEACRDLLSVIPYAWIGVCFSRERREARSLAGEMMLYGDAPCQKEEFRFSVDLIASSLVPGTPRILVGEDRGAFACDSSQIAVIPFGKQDALVGVIVAGGKTNHDDAVTSIEIKMLEAVAGHMLVLIENAGLYAEQRDTFLGTLQALTTAIDAKDRYTCGHSERVAYMSEQIALAAGLSPNETERIRISGLVHDVGKIGVPESVLRKPGKLTDEEYDAIKLHPEIGHAILRDIPQLEDVLPGVLYHHERWDGRGYPFGLKSEEIPMMARVIGLADAFDAMSSSRTYRTAMPRSKVLSEIEKGAGTQFDADLARRFLTIDLSAYDEMVARHHSQANAEQGRAA